MIIVIYFGLDKLSLMDSSKINELFLNYLVDTDPTAITMQYILLKLMTTYDYTKTL